jgi:uridine kinase
MDMSEGIAHLRKSADKKILVVGPTASGKSTLANSKCHYSKIANVEAYFMTVEKDAKLPSDRKIVYMSKDPLSWDNPKSYDAELFVRHINEHFLNDGSSPIWLKQEDSTRRFMRKADKPDTVQPSDVLVVDVAFPSIARKIIKNCQPDSVYFVTTSGEGLGIKGRTIRRILRQCNHDVEFQIKTAAVSQLFHAREFQKLAKLLDSTPKVYRVNNDFTDQEIEWQLRNKKARKSLIDRGFSTKPVEDYRHFKINIDWDQLKIRSLNNRLMVCLDGGDEIIGAELPIDRLTVIKKLLKASIRYDDYKPADIVT